jgi:hypothetical protein
MYVKDRFKEINETVLKATFELMQALFDFQLFK